MTHLIVLVRTTRVVDRSAIVLVYADDGLDDTLWWFKADAAFSGNLGAAYGGVLEFTLGSFSGSFLEGIPSLLNDSICRQYSFKRLTTGEITAERSLSFACCNRISCCCGMHECSIGS